MLQRSSPQLPQGRFSGFFSDLWCTLLQVLTPVQVARYHVACLPMGPDTLALLTCLALQSDEPSTDDMLQAEAAARARDAEGAAAGSAARPGAAACPSRPTCAAGDWRRAFALPLCKLHAFPRRPAITVAPTADVRRMAGAATTIADAGADKK